MMPVVTAAKNGWSVVVSTYTDSRDPILLPSGSTTSFRRQSRMFSAGNNASSSGRGQRCVPARRSPSRTADLRNPVPPGGVPRGGSEPEEDAVKGDRVEVVLDAGGSSRTYE